jgi:hypothetical protein
LSTMTADIKRRVALWVAAFAIAIAAALAFSQAMSGSSNAPTPLQNITQTSHKVRCAKYKKGSKKKRKCKEDCGVGPGGYGRPNDHPNHPRQCRDW